MTLDNSATLTAKSNQMQALRSQVKENLILKFHLLDKQTIQSYQHLTYPFWRDRLQQPEFQQSMVAIGVSHNAQPIGLAIAIIVPKTDQGQILSLFVKPEYRQQGIGGNLLQYLSQRLETLGCRKVEINYTTKSNTTFALESLLRRQNWSTPESKTFMCYTTTELIKKAPWLDSSFLPPAFQIFPLAELTKQEYQNIQQRQDFSSWYPEVLSPFSGEMPIEPFNSLGLRYLGEVVGWMATHRIAPDTIRYTSLFVRKDLQKMGRAIPLLVKAIKLQVNSEILNGTFAVNVDNISMMRFVRRRLQPFLSQVRESKISHKLLTTD